MLQSVPVVFAVHVILQLLPISQLYFTKVTRDGAPTGKQTCQMFAGEAATMQTPITEPRVGHSACFDFTGVECEQTVAYLSVKIIFWLFLVISVDMAPESTRVQLVQQSDIRACHEIQEHVRSLKNTIVQYKCLQAILSVISTM